MNLVFDIPPPVIAPTTRGDGFPVRRVFCIGRNYAAHVAEMGGDAKRQPPFFFTKWAEAVVPSGSTIAYPPGTENYHYEGEMVVAMGHGGRDIQPSAASRHIYGYAAGLDMTRRDLQSAMREAGQPWDIAKNVEQAAPLGPISPADGAAPLDRGGIVTRVNGEVKQKGDIADMIWSVADLIAHISHYYRLEAGDLIYTGTPSGIGPVRPGDELVVTVEGLPECSVTIGERARY
jgi:fumarylpyruvate hydrolase